MNKLSKYIKLSAVAAMAFAFAAVPVARAATVVIAPSDTQGWTAYTTDGGTATIISDPTVPDPYKDGVLQLKTTTSLQSRAQYYKDMSVPLADVQNVSYMTKQISALQPNASGPFAQGSASLGLGLDLSGDGVRDTTLVYEPYWQVSQGTNTQEVVTGEWQTWSNIQDGAFWSSANYTGVLNLTAGAGGPPFYTLQQLLTAYPDAKLVRLVTYVGSYNPGYEVNVDAVTLNDTTYNFELTAPDTQRPSIPQNLGWTSPTVACGGTTSSYSITATWGTSTDNVGVTGYNYQVYTPAGTAYATSPWSTNVTTNSYPGAFTMGEGTYTYQVQAVDAAGNVSAWSQPCAVTYDTTPEVLGKNECKDGGWKNVYTADNKKFKNQGQCVAYVESSDNSAHHRTVVLPGVRF